MLDKENLLKLSTYFSLVVAVIIIIAKIVAWIMTDSMTIFAVLIDSILDLFASSINLFALHYSLQPADNEHRFGHGKAEDLAVFIQSSIFGISGIFILGASIKRFCTPIILEQSEIGLYFLLFSTGLTLVLVLFQQYVLRKHSSKIVEADHLHYFSDLLTNTGSIMTIYLGHKFGFIYADPIFAAIIAVIILKAAYELWSTAFKNLMDHEFSIEEKTKITDLIINNEKITGFHDLKTRYSGTRPIIQLHIELDKNLPLKEVHEITEKLEGKILKIFPGADIIIHPDPDDIIEIIEFKEI